MPNYQGVWSLSEQYQNASGWPVPPTPPIGLFQLETTIEFINISTTGNAADFGDKTTSVHHCGACGSSTRGIFGGGENTTNIIDFVTFASAGNATDFGDLTLATTAVGISNETKGVFQENQTTPAAGSMSQITIASTGNAASFGDLSVARGVSGSGSSAHGGLT